jgi:hypothetical protein
LKYLPSLGMLALLLSAPAAKAVEGFVAPPQHRAEDLALQPDLFALSTDGRLATAAIGPSGVTIRVYSGFQPQIRRLLFEQAYPQLGFVGGLAFADPGTLLLSENSHHRTVFSLSLNTGVLTPLAPADSVPNAADVARRATDGAVFVVAANQPGSGVLYRIINNAAAPVATGLGHGYLGGLAIDLWGSVAIGDSNDPTFVGNAGRILVFSPQIVPQNIIDLAPAGGSGIYGLAADSAGNLFATTGETVTRVDRRSGAVQEFGRFSGLFPFPTGVAVAERSGAVLVNGLFTEVGGLFAIHPVRPRQPIFPIWRAPFNPAMPGILPRTFR